MTQLEARVEDMKHFVVLQHSAHQAEVEGLGGAHKPRLSDCVALKQRSESLKTHFVE